EKVDGANVSIRRDGDKDVPWSRGGPLGSSNKYYFDAFRRYVFEGLTPHIYDLPEDLIIFGEFTHGGYGHILYDQQNLNTLFLIAVYNAKDEHFLPPSQSLEWLELLDLHNQIRMTPLLKEGKIDHDGINDLLLQKSSLYSGPLEGIVIHQYGSEFPEGLRMEKQYHPDFIEHDPNKVGLENALNLKRYIKAGQRLVSNDQTVTVNSILEEARLDLLRELSNSSRPSANNFQFSDRMCTEVEERVIPLFR
ncbi:MAG: RNA ligase family protein, partial [Nanoarchaeota archaeon]|nr:RNA ligase family protein [Nanoarchaeota archaeon]